jgi:predicted MFS family arabinose efflux permease
VASTIRSSADRATRLTLLQLSLHGYFLYAFGPSIPFLRDEFGISSALAGLHSTAMSMGAIIAGTLGVQLVRRFGRGRMRWIGVSMLAAGALLYAVAPGVSFSMLAVILTGTGGSIIVNATNVALLQHHEGARGPMWASYAHAFAATIGTLAPVLIGVTVAVGLGWRPPFLLIPIGAAVIALLMRGTAMRGDTVVEAREATPTGASARLSPTFWWIFSGLLFGVAVEFCLTVWVTDLLRQSHGLADATAAWAFSVMLVGLTAARWFAGGLSLRIGTARVIGGGLILLFFGVALLLIVPTPTVGFVSMFIIGIGLGPQYPFVIARTIAAAGAAGDKASSVASVGIGLTVATAPFALGAAADAVGVVTAFYVIPVLVLASLACLTVARSSQMRSWIG